MQCISSRNIDDVFCGQKVALEIVEWLKTIKHSLKIFTGEANITIFANPRIVHEIELCAKRGVVVEVVAGPILSCYSLNRKLETPLIDLVRKGLIKLYYRPTRGNTSHFVISDDKLVRVQMRHASCAPLYLRRWDVVSIKRESSPGRWLKKFNRYATPENLAKSPRKQFLLVRKQNLFDIFGSRDNARLNRLTKVQLLRAIKKGMAAHEKRVMNEFERVSRKALFLP